MSREWTAKWIGLEEGDLFRPVIFKDFYLDDPVVKATLYITGAGLFEAYVNGLRVGDEHFTPYRNSLASGMQYFSYDVTALLHSGPDSDANSIDIFLGKGWDNDIFGDRFAVRAEFVIEVEKQVRRVVCPEKTEEAALSAEEESMYDELEAELDLLSEDPEFWRMSDDSDAPEEAPKEVLLLAMKGKSRSKKGHTPFELKDLDELDDFLKNVIGDDKPGLDLSDGSDEEPEPDFLSAEWLPTSEEIEQIQAESVLETPEEEFLPEWEEPESILPETFELEDPDVFEEVVPADKSETFENSDFAEAPVSGEHVEGQEAEELSEADEIKGVLEEADEAQKVSEEADEASDELDLDIFDFEDWDELGIRRPEKKEPIIHDLEIRPYSITDDALDALFEDSIDPMLETAAETEEAVIEEEAEKAFEEPEENEELAAAEEPEELEENEELVAVEEAEEPEENEELVAAEEAEEPEENEELAAVEEPEEPEENEELAAVEEAEEPEEIEELEEAEGIEEPAAEEEAIETEEEEPVAEEPVEETGETEALAAEEELEETEGIEEPEEAPAAIEAEEECEIETVVETIIIGTDETWGYYASDIVTNDLKEGENFNRIFWSETDNPEKNVAVLDYDVPLVERYALPVKIQESLPVCSTIRAEDGSWILDFGQTFTGFVSFHSELEAGSEVKLTFARRLSVEGAPEEEGGSFTYVSDGVAEQVSPHFAFFTGRYVKVEGFGDTLSPEAFTACVLYASMQQTGAAVTTNPHLNQILKERRSLQKRAAFTETDALFAPGASYQLDIQSFLQSGIGESLLPEQKETAGRIWNLYQMYGNESFLSAHYDQMKCWTDQIAALDAKGRTPQYLCSFVPEEETFSESAWFYQNAKWISLAAKELGNDQDAFCYEKLSRKIKQAILEEYYTVTGRFALDTQSDYILALAFGLTADREKTTEAFLRRMEKEEWKVCCRDEEMPLLLSLLTDCKYVDKAYDMLLDLSNEALQDSTVQFIYDHMAGIRPLEPGFERAEIAPLPDGRITQCAVSVRTVRGTIVSNWTISPDGTLSFHFEVPEGITCRIVLPYYPVCAANGNEMTVNGGSYDYSYMPGVRLVPVSKEQ